MLSDCVGDANQEFFHVFVFVFSCVPVFVFSRVPVFVFFVFPCLFFTCSPCLCFFVLPCLCFFPVPVFVFSRVRVIVCSRVCLFFPRVNAFFPRVPFFASVSVFYRVSLCPCFFPFFRDAVYVPVSAFSRITESAPVSCVRIFIFLL